MKTSYGGVVFDEEGRVLLRLPSGGYEGTTWTFAKGGSNPGETAEETALREVREELGVRARIVARIPGRYDGTTTWNEYFVMQLVEQETKTYHETAEVRRLPPTEARALIETTTDRTKRRRDLAVLDAALALRGAAAPPTAAAPPPATEDSLLDRALEVATEAALEAGALLRADFHGEGGPRGSGSHAEADEEAERLIRARLTKAFPTWTYMGEEMGGTLPHGNEPGWLVDPNDGTSAYLKGFRGAAVSIALVRGGLPVLGVVYAHSAPDDAGDLFTWHEGASLRRNGVPVAREPLPEVLNHTHLVLLNQKGDDDPAASAARLAPARYRCVPSIAYRLALVAAGEADATESRSGPTDWDVAGGHGLLRAVGGELLQDDGRPVRYDGGGVGNVVGGSTAAAEALLRHASKTVPGAVASKDPVLAALGPVRLMRGEAVADAGILARAQGCLLGQLAGDALGSRVEFQRAGTITRAYPNGVRDLADGGVWRTLAGQPTDDSELALLLARCLVRDGRHDDAAVREAYQAWLRSRPFDVGTTTRAGLDRRPNLTSCANGSLMRVSPLGVWGFALDPGALGELARTHSGLTHPSEVCRDACAVFAVAVGHAVRTGEGPRAVYDAALAFAEARATDATVLQALRGAATDPVGAWTGDGDARLALQNAFYRLLHAASVEEALVATVGLGGDTDTTAAIAGALLGAVHGREAVPLRWRRAVLGCRPVAGLAGVEQPRPMAFWPVDALALAERLLIAGARAASDRGR